LPSGLISIEKTGPICPLKVLRMVPASSSIVWFPSEIASKLSSALTKDDPIEKKTNIKRQKTIAKALNIFIEIPHLVTSAYFNSQALS
jgi:hypothetical protein